MNSEAATLTRPSRPLVGAPRGTWAVAPIAALIGLGVAQFGIRAAVVAAAATVMVLSIVQPAVGVVVFALFAPFDAYLKPFTIFKDLMWIDAVMAAVMVGLLLRVWAKHTVCEPVAWIARPGPEYLATLGGIAALTLMQLSWTPFTPDWLDTIDNALRSAFLLSMLAIVAPTMSPRLALLAATALVVGTVARLGVEAVPFFAGGNFVLHPSYQFGRWTSNPNTLAGLAAPVLPIAVALGLASRSRGARIFLVGCAGAIGSAVIISFSKGAWVAAAASIVVLGFAGRRWIHIGHVLTVGAVVLIAAVVSPRVRQVPALMVERWTSPASTISNAERLKYIRVAARLIGSHPTLGVGLEQFPNAFRASTAEPFGPEDPHNAYLLIASELGVPALGAFLLLLGGIAAAAGRVAGMKSIAWGPGLVAAVTAVCVVQLFTSDPWSSRVFWTVALLPWGPIFARAEPA